MEEENYAALFSPMREMELCKEINDVNPDSRRVVESNRKKKKGPSIPLVLHQPN